MFPKTLVFLQFGFKITIAHRQLMALESELKYTASHLRYRDNHSWLGIRAFDRFE